MHGPYAGWHLIVDAFVESGDSTDRLADRQFLEEFLRDLVLRLDMKILGGPYMRTVMPDPKLIETEKDEGGVTGCVVITTSHITIHTWPLRQRFSLDIYSCKEFDSDAAKKLIQGRLGVTRWSTNWLQRLWP